MTNRIEALRTILIAAIVGVVVYAYSMQENMVKTRFAKIVYSEKNALWSNQWMGLSTWQNPNDAWIIQEIISELRPDYIVETGTFRGGSAVLWATVLREVNPDGKVITIDIEDQTTQARRLDVWKRSINFLLGSSTDPKIVAQVAQAVKGKKTLVILDALHTKDHVLKELEIYAPMVNMGSYIVVQDSQVNGHPVHREHGPGPMEAIEAFLAKSGDFQPDLDRERLMHTTNPRGYLKRLK
jgi:cephalosporin hydroxylase